jgi:hypothetical protein
MSNIYTLEVVKDFEVGKQKVQTRSLIACCKPTVFDELWMILDYVFIGALYYLNTVYIHSKLFAFGLFIWLMLMVFLYPREKKVRVENKEELLKIIDTFYEKNEMDK